MGEGKYRKKVCSECELIIHTKDDEEQLRALGGSTEYLHVACLADYERKVKAAKKKYSKGGKPPSITPAVKTILNHAFSCGANNVEACLYAGICVKTLDRYKKKNPTYSLEIEKLRSNPRLQSKLINGEKLKKRDGDTAKYILDRTDPEYKPKSKSTVEVEGNKSLIDAILARKGKS